MSHLGSYGDLLAGSNHSLSATSIPVEADIASFYASLSQHFGQGAHVAVFEMLSIAQGGDELVLDQYDACGCRHGTSLLMQKLH